MDWGTSESRGQKITRELERRLGCAVGTSAENRMEDRAAAGASAI